MTLGSSIAMSPGSTIRAGWASAGHLAFLASGLILGQLISTVRLHAADSTADQVVQVELCEQGLADRDVWPDEAPVPTETFTLPAFALHRLPAKYVGDGVRGERPSPSLLRMTATVTLPAGRHRVVLRSRSAARFHHGDTLVVETPFPPKNGGDGSQHDTERKDPLDLGPGYRFAPGGEYERIGELVATGSATSVKLEAFVGGREGKTRRRVELGETVVAIALDGTNDWRVLTAEGLTFPYTDAAWRTYTATVDRGLDDYEAIQRRVLRKSFDDDVWRQRHAIGQGWLAATAEVPVPDSSVDESSSHPIDRFLAARLETIRHQHTHADNLTERTVDYFRDIQPILQARCAECHTGTAPKGGLRLDDRDAVLRGGDSGPAARPGASDDSELLRRVVSDDPTERMPPQGAPLTEAEQELLRRWIAEGLTWPELPLLRTTFNPPCDDATFLRRAMLDTIGVPPTIEELHAFLDDDSPDKRAQVIDRLLADHRWADGWMPFWQDLLAENPNILNPTLNNTGPFRWWLYDVLRDDLPIDRMVTQLIMQEGAAPYGGPAGFGLASENDAPFATKGTILSAAFLGVEMKCARCHDSPSGSAKQEQLFQLGALLAAAPLDVPKTSSVDPAKLRAGGRTPLIEVTLAPGSRVEPAWPFADFIEPAGVTHDETPRARLAALLTDPRNERFAQVLVNRLWARYMGRGLVEPRDSWEQGRPTHPELLRWLGRELVRADYQLKPIARLILTSAAYQRTVDPTLRQPDPLFTAPEPRRLLAEQVVDSLLVVTGKDPRLEPVCLDLNGRRDETKSIHLGLPRRAWMLSSLSNERDRPSLMLPRLQAVTDVLSALGWRGARQDPASTRDHAPNALQPAILANGVFMGWLTRLSDDHPLTAIALDADSPAALVDQLTQRILSRPPTEDERLRYVALLETGFTNRVFEPLITVDPPPHAAPVFVTWTNHLLPESNTAKLELAAAAERGDPPTLRLEPGWRERCEDLIWALLNAPENLYRP